jgi:lipopolysaccharide biosynthesis glycosyltransferase
VKPVLIHLAFATDAEGIAGLAVASYSALEMSSRPVHLWVVVDRVQPGTRRRLEAMWQRCDTYEGSTFVEMSDLPHSMPSWWIRKAWPLTSAARFQLADVLPATVHRCLYADFDVLFGIDPALLFDMHLQGHPVGMVRYTGMGEDVQAYLKTIDLDPAVYCNAGVLLMDLDAWRREDAGRRLVAVGRAMPPSIWFFDQDMLNTYFKGRCLLLEEHWNLRDARVPPDGCIQHFAGKGKPWQTTAATATLPGHVAWHQAMARSGFQSTATAAHVKWRKVLTLVMAKLQRGFMRALRDGGAGERTR